MYGKRDNQLPSRFIEEMGIVSERPQRKVSNYSYDSDWSDSNYGYGSRSSYSSNNYSSSYNKSSSSSYATYDDYASKLNSYDNNKVGSVSGNNSNIQNVMIKKLDNQKGKFSEYKVGVQVLHTKFGVGTIVKVDGGESNYVSVDFGKLGVKTLSLNFAPLQILK